MKNFQNLMNALRISVFTLRKPKIFQNLRLIRWKNIQNMRTHHIFIVIMFQNLDKYIEIRGLEPKNSTHLNLFTIEGKMALIGQLERER